MESFTPDQGKELEKEILAIKAELGMWIEDMSDSVSSMESHVEGIRQLMQNIETGITKGPLPTDHPLEIIFRKKLEDLKIECLAFEKSIKDYRNEIELLKADYKVAEDIVLKKNRTVH